MKSNGEFFTERFSPATFCLAKKFVEIDPWCRGLKQFLRTAFSAVQISDFSSFTKQFMNVSNLPIHKKASFLSPLLKFIG